MTATLEVSGLETVYGTSQILFGIDLTIQQGEIVTLLGRNGMGKTTTVRSILGLTPARRGSICFRGERIERHAPDRIGRAGIAVVPEGRQIFRNLSVRENLIAFAGNRNASRDPWTLERIYALFPRLADRQSNMGHQLSGGEQQMLAVGRALMTNPHLLILDEATEGLAPLIREEIWRCLATLRQANQTILIALIAKPVDTAPIRLLPSATPVDLRQLRKLRSFSASSGSSGGLRWQRHGTAASIP